MAYSTFTLIDKNTLGDGRIEGVFEFNGNAGEPARVERLMIEEGMTNAAIREWADRVASRLNGRKSAGDNLVVGTTVNIRAVPGPAAPTAQQVWIDKARRLARLRELWTVTTSTLLTEINALAADVRDSYQAGWLTGL